MPDSKNKLIITHNILVHREIQNKKLQIAQLNVIPDIVKSGYKL
jgi:hypothetical protein